MGLNERPKLHKCRRRVGGELSRHGLLQLSVEGLQRIKPFFPRGIPLISQIVGVTRESVKACHGRPNGSRTQPTRNWEIFVVFNTHG